MGTRSQTNGQNLVIWLWNPFMFIDDRTSYDANFCKRWQISGLSFFIATSGNNRMPCQRIDFFEFSFSLFEFFWINFQICRHGHPLKGVELSKTMDVYLMKPPLVHLKWFLRKIMMKLSHACSSNLNNFREIGIN